MIDSHPDADLDALLADRARLWRAQFALATNRPLASARRLAGPGTYAAIGAAAVALVLGAWTVPRVVAPVLYLAAAALAAAVSLRRLQVRRQERERAHLPRAHVLGPLPPYAVLVPVPSGVRPPRDLLSSLAALRYAPRALDVVVLVDASDAAGVRTWQDAVAPDERARVVTVPVADRASVATSCNFALETLRCTFVAVVGVHHRPAPDELVAAADHLAAADERVATVLRRPVPVRARRGLTRRLDGRRGGDPSLPLARVDAPCHHRVDAVRRAGGWDPFNHDPLVDLRFRLQRDGYRTERLAGATSVEPLGDPVEVIQRDALRAAGLLQSWRVGRQERNRVCRRDGWRASLDTAGAVLVALLRPVLFTVSVLLLARPSGAAGLVATFPRPLVAVAALVVASAAAGWGAALVRGGREGTSGLADGAAAPLLALSDACAAVEGLMTLAAGAPEGEGARRVPRGSGPQLVVGS